jgi:hypothetical protein
MNQIITIRARAAALLAGLALALSGCFMSPGKFTSELYLTGPDSFTFTYEGEIFFLGLSKLAQMGAAADTETFTPNCVDEETYEERECTAEEVDAQRTEWDASAAQRAEEKKREAQQMAAMMGGIDPSDPEAAEELVHLLERQKGWNRVVHKGDGVFEVSYSVTSTLGHDFLFPTIEGFPATNPFVQMILRDGGQVRINAPAFVVQNGDNPMSALMGNMAPLAGMAAMEAAGQNGVKEDAEQIPGMPMLDGTFTIRTAPGMRILANNTDEGAAGAPGGGELLRWTISPRTKQAPTALVATGS